METENKIRKFIVQNLYYSEEGFIADNASFLETGVIDSMGVMELVAFVQSEFGIEVAQEEVTVENFDSIRKLADFVRRKVSSEAPSAPSSESSGPSRSAPLAAR